MSLRRSGCADIYIGAAPRLDSTFAPDQAIALRDPAAFEIVQSVCEAESSPRSSLDSAGPELATSYNSQPRVRILDLTISKMQNQQDGYPEGYTAALRRENRESCLTPEFVQRMVAFCSRSAQENGSVDNVINELFLEEIKNELEVIKRFIRIEGTPQPVGSLLLVQGDADGR